MQNFVDLGSSDNTGLEQAETAGDDQSKIPVNGLPESPANGNGVSETSEAKGEDDSGAACALIEPFPERVITGAAGYFAKTYAKHVESPEQFLFMSFLTCLGSKLSKQLTLKSELNVQPRLFTILLGESADVRKSTAINKAVNLFEETFADTVPGWATGGFNYCRGVGSDGGLHNRLKENGQLLLCIDEFKSFLHKCEVQNSTLLPCVNTLFEDNFAENQTKDKDIRVRDAYLALLAASTTETYQRVWKPAFTAIGLNNRLFLVPAEGKRLHAIPDKVPEGYKEGIKVLLRGVVEIVGERLELEMTPAAKARYDLWYHSRESSVYSRRLDVYAARLMTLLAVNDFKREIDEETVEKATRLCDWQLAVRRQYEPVDADSKYAQMEQSIRKALKRKTHTENELRRACNADRAGLHIFRQALDELKKAGEVVYDVNTKRLKPCTPQE